MSYVDNITGNSLAFYSALQETVDPTGLKAGVGLEFFRFGKQ